MGYLKIKFNSLQPMVADFHSKASVLCGSFDGERSCNIPSISRELLSIIFHVDVPASMVVIKSNKNSYNHGCSKGNEL